MKVTIICAAAALACLARRLAKARPERYAHVAKAYYTSVVLCMLAQEYALYRDGLLTLANALPLHLCSFSGLFLCLPALLARHGAAYDFFICLSAPAAALALVFPAITRTSAPLFTESAFLLMHALLLLVPFVRASRSAVRNTRTVRGVMTIACSLLAAASLANAAFGANYLFLSRPPPGTPLALLSGLPEELRALAYLLIAYLAALARHYAKERGHHEKENRHSDQRGRLSGAERGDSRRGARGV